MRDVFHRVVSQAQVQGSWSEQALRTPELMSPGLASFNTLILWIIFILSSPAPLYRWEGVTELEGLQQGGILKVSEMNQVRAKVKSV